MRTARESILNALFCVMRCILCLSFLCCVVLGAFFWLPANVHYHVIEKHNFSNLGEDTRIYLGALIPKSGPYQWVGKFEISWDGIQQIESYDFVDVVKLSAESYGQENLEATIEYDVKLPQRSVSWLAPVESFQRLPQVGIESDCDCLQVQAMNLSDGISEKDAYKIYSFITDYLTYSNENMDDSNASAIQAYQIGSCTCAGFARLMTALCRASGIPSQLVIGYIYPDPVFQPNLSSFTQGEAHAWVEYYSEGTWKLADPTFGSKRLKILYFNRNDGRHISYGELEQVIFADAMLQDWALDHASLIVGDDDSFRYVATSGSDQVSLTSITSIQRRWDGRWVNTLIIWGITTWLLCRYRYKIIGLPRPTSIKTNNLNIS